MSTPSRLPECSRKAWRRALELRNPLAGLRREAEAQRDATLAKARALLAHGRTPEQALEFLAHTLTNKLLHTPSANLREAAQRGDVDLLRAAEQLFDSAPDEGKEEKSKHGKGGKVDKDA